MPGPLSRCISVHGLCVRRRRRVLFFNGIEIRPIYISESVIAVWKASEQVRLPEEALERFTVICVYPIVVEQDIYLCRFGELDQLVERSFGATLRRQGTSTSRRRTPDSAGLRECESQDSDLRVSGARNRGQLVVREKRGRSLQRCCVVYQVISIINQGEGLRIIKAMNEISVLEIEADLQWCIAVLCN
jgi:hypothetical protein